MAARRAGGAPLVALALAASTSASPGALTPPFSNEVYRVLLRQLPSALRQNGLRETGEHIPGTMLPFVERALAGPTDDPPPAPPPAPPSATSAPSHTAPPAAAAATHSATPTLDRLAELERMLGQLKMPEWRARVEGEPGVS